jgi:transposase-like protein
VRANLVRCKPWERNFKVFSKVQTRQWLKWAEAAAERNRRGELERRRRWRARAAAWAAATVEFKKFIGSNKKFQPKEYALLKLS